MNLMSLELGDCLSEYERPNDRLYALNMNITCSEPPLSEKMLKITAEQPAGVANPGRFALYFTREEAYRMKEAIEAIFSEEGQP